MKKIIRQDIEVKTDVGKWARMCPRQYVKAFNVMRTDDGLVISMETIEEVKLKKWYQFWK